jgi:hypothetical protein
MPFSHPITFKEKLMKISSLSPFFAALPRFAMNYWFGCGMALALLLGIAWAAQPHEPTTAGQVSTLVLPQAWTAQATAQNA